MKYLAQQIVIDEKTIEGPLAFNTLGEVISRVVNVFLIPIASVILLLVFIWAGYDFMMSEGNPEKIKSAQAKITSGIIGLVLLISAFLIVRVVELILGFRSGIF
jgi:TRAP-type C4-dicarboxylate transport system permease small subunit